MFAWIDSVPCSLAENVVVYAMLKYVSLWNQCDIPYSCIVCDITPLQNFFFDITPVLSKTMPPLPKPHVMCHHCSCQAHKKAKVGTWPMLCSSLIQLLVESYMDHEDFHVWRYTVVNLMLLMWHIPLCLVVYSCMVGASWSKYL